MVRKEGRHKIYKDRIRTNIFNITGNYCVKCLGWEGDLKMLELHHIDPNNKSFNLSCRSYKDKKQSIVYDEAKKCLPLCPNCHRAYHLDYWDYSSLDLSILKEYQIELIKNYGISK